MLRSVPMVHMQIQVPNRQAAAVTRQIAAAGLLHLIDIAHGRIAASDAAPPGTHEQLAAVRDLARRTRRIAERLDLALPEPAGTLPAGDLREFSEEQRWLDEQIRPIESAVDEVWRRRTAARERASHARSQLKHADRFTRAALDTTRLAGLRFATVVLGMIRIDEMPALAAALAPAPFAIVTLEASEGVAFAAVAAPATVRARLDDGLRLVAFEQMSLTDLTAATSDSLTSTLDEAAATEHDTAAGLHTLKEQHAEAVAELSQRAEVAALLLQAQTHFVAAGRFVVISGWIPESDAAKMGRAITAVSDGRAVVDLQKPEDLPEASESSLRIPILYRNPVLLRPFQTLVQMYGVPSYGEIQPTAFFAVSFLLMFGLMFGDVGQGLVLFSAGYCLFRYLPRFLDYGILLMECGAASTVFGALYGSLFGIEGLLPVLWMEPIRDLPRFMGIAIGFGIVVVSLGLMMNIVNSWRTGERASALFGPRGVFGAFVYWIGLALVARALMPSTLVVPVPLLMGMAAAAALLLVLRRPIVRYLERGSAGRKAHADGPRWLTALEGSVELVDALFAYFANTISFVRVAAFAAVHAGVFIAMFALADTLAHSRFGQPLGIVTLVLGNVVMIFLEGLTVSVQVLRLEYYEFFGKFFRGGGELYRPLMLRKGGG
jgi:V/A-type H+-transporting ATPase subunit I